MITGTDEQRALVRILASDPRIDVYKIRWGHVRHFGYHGSMRGHYVEHTSYPRLWAAHDVETLIHWRVLVRHANGSGAASPAYRLGDKLPTWAEIIRVQAQLGT